MTVSYSLSANGLWLTPTAVDRAVQESVAQLELALEDRDWINLASAGQTEFSRAGLSTIISLCRLFYLKNPLVNRAISVKADYVFGRQVNIAAKDDDINEVVQAFLNDRHNQRELTSQQARIQKEVELETDGNIFWCFVIHPLTGRVRVRSIPVGEITKVITNPDYRKEPWYYLREWTEITLDIRTGEEKRKQRRAYYPDWEYRPSSGYPSKIGTISVEPTPVYHVKIGGFSDWAFGVPEVYSAVDWAKAYTKFLENWSSLVAAYARFAWIASTAGGDQAVQNMKSRLGTTLGTGTRETNPPPVTASTLITSKNAQGNANVDLQPVRTAGATTGAADGRYLRLMVAAATGFPETFFGDADVGNHATAQTLDRPTELGVSNRQMLWSSIYHGMIDYVIFWSVTAPKGKLRGIATPTVDEYGETALVFDDDVNDHIDVDFPPITEHSLKEYVDSVVAGSTLNGQTPSVITDKRLIAQMVLTALGQNDIDELLDAMYPLDGSLPTADPNIAPPDEAQQLADQLMQVATEVKQVLEQMVIDLRENLTPQLTGNGILHN